MTKTEVAKLLALASTVDNRTVTEEAVNGWYQILEFTEYEAAVKALWAHFGESTKWLLPAHIKERVAAARVVKPISDASHYCKTHWMPKVENGRCERCLEAVAS